MTKQLILRCSPGALLTAPGFAGRDTVSLDGTWQIAGTARWPAPNCRPPSHTGPVPGLANLRQPRHSPAWTPSTAASIWPRRIQGKLAPEDWLTKYPNGKVEQDRDYFWYRRTFRRRPGGPWVC